jgi:hypothetical protein
VRSASLFIRGKLTGRKGKGDLDVEKALVVKDVDGGRVFRGEVLCADDVDPGRAGMCAVSKFVSQRKS